MESVGNRLLFQVDASAVPILVEICEDLWVPIPRRAMERLPRHCSAHLSASNITVQKRTTAPIVLSQSAKCMSAYLYSALEAAQSTTDLAWDGMP